jgi:hypothetical protein
MLELFLLASLFRIKLFLGYVVILSSYNPKSLKASPHVIKMVFGKFMTAIPDLG